MEKGLNFEKGAVAENNQESPESLNSQIEFLRKKKDTVIRKLKMLTVYTGIVLSPFAMSSCNEPGMQEAQNPNTTTQQDSVKISAEKKKDSTVKANALFETEKRKGVLRISKETLHELSEINQTLVNASPGEKIGGNEILSFAEDSDHYHSLVVDGMLGHETSEYTTTFLFHQMKGQQLTIDCISNEVCKGFITKQYDADGVVTFESWANSTVISGKKVVVVYNISYFRNVGEFDESLKVYEDKNTSTGDPGSEIKELGFELTGLDKRPDLPNEEYVTVGGTPEHFFQKAIEAFKQAERK